MEVFGNEFIDCCHMFKGPVSLNKLCHQDLDVVESCEQFFQLSFTFKIIFLTFSNNHFDYFSSISRV